MTRRENWSLRDLFPIAVLVCIAAVFLMSGCEEDTTSPTPDPTINDGGGELPLCGKHDDGRPCRPVEADAGPPDGGCLPDQGTGESPDSQVPPADQGAEVSPDTTTPPADQGTPPEPCPPSDIPDGTTCGDFGCLIYWQRDSATGSCLSDCNGGFGNHIGPQDMRTACGFGDPA